MQVQADDIAHLLDEQRVARQLDSPSPHSTTRSTSSSPILRGAPGRGSSSNPSQPSSRNRRRHLPTVARVVPSSSAASRSLFPVVVSRMIRARRESACEVFGRPPYPASQFLQLFIRRLWNLSGMMVRHFRALPGTGEGYHTPIYWASTYDTVHTSTSRRSSASSLRHAAVQPRAFPQNPPIPHFLAHRSGCVQRFHTVHRIFTRQRRHVWRGTGNRAAEAWSTA